MRRTPSGAGVVAVTGASSGVGRALVERLAARHDLDGLLGLDPVPARVDGVVWRTGALLDGRLSARLVGVDTVVHLATCLDPLVPPRRRRELNVDGAAAVLAAAADVGVRRVVLCTSADVYGVRTGQSAPRPDAAALCAADDPDTLLADLLAVEGQVRLWREKGLHVTVLRPALLVGLPAVHDAPRLRQLAAPRLLAVPGVEPLWQLCHLEDLVSALERAVDGAVEGDLGVACDGALTQREVEALTGRRRLELPADVARTTAARLQRVGSTGVAPTELDHVLGHLVLECDGLHRAGWAPAWSNEAALSAHLRARSAEGRSAAYTAAGATVAVLGAAALVRQARRRRRL